MIEPLVRDRFELVRARWVFLDPVARERYVDWPVIARECVASLRMDAGRHPDDPELAGLVGELTVKSPEFGSWWSDHDVKHLSHGTKRHYHPVVGELTIAYEAMAVADAPDQTLFIYTTEPGSSSEQALQLLANWTLQEVAPTGPDGAPRDA